MTITLQACVGKIREDYEEDLKSKEMRIRQRAVALYFIDKLALRAGHEKEEGETADTVGCCSLRVEHVSKWEDYSITIKHSALTIGLCVLQNASKQQFAMDLEDGRRNVLASESCLP